MTGRAGRRSHLEVRHDRDTGSRKRPLLPGGPDGATPAGRDVQ